MIVLRKKQPLYIISTKPDLEKHILYPTIPNNFLINGGYINSKLPRIQVFKSISDAISATFLGQKLRPGSKMYVYEITDIEPESLIGPLDIADIPYYGLIKEWWYLKSCNPKFISEIEIGKLRKEEIYMYSPRQTKAILYKYDWTEIQKPWEKKFGPKLPKEKFYSDPLENLNDRQLEVLADKVVAHRRKKRLDKKKLQGAKDNTLTSSEKINLSPTTQDEAVQRATKLINYKKTVKSEQNILRNELINTIRDGN